MNVMSSSITVKSQNITIFTSVLVLHGAYAALVNGGEDAVVDDKKFASMRPRRQANSLS